jgi:hypothetical protein
VRWSTADDSGSWLPRKRIADSAVRKLEEEICSATGRRDAEHAETREGFELEKVVSCGSGGQWRGTKLDLGSREFLDDYHRATTLGTAPKVLGVAGG